EEVAQIAHHVAALPADLDPFGSRRDGFGDARLRIELLAHLVEVGDSQSGPDLHAAFGGLERAEHDAQRGGLAGAVGADQADAVAALDQGREVAYHPALALGRVEALADVEQLGDTPPGASAGVEPDAQVAHPLATLLALAAQGLEAAHPALVARAPGLDALTDPRFLLLPEAVEPPPLLRLHRKLVRL